MRSHYVGQVGVFGFLRQSFALVAQAGVQRHDLDTHCNLHLLGSSNFPASVSRIGRIIGIHHHPQLILYF